MNLYCYIYIIDGKNVPLLELTSSSKMLLNKNDYTIISNNKYYFDFKHGFFDSISSETIEYIDKIFKFVEKEHKISYLNEKLWIEYVDALPNKSLRMYYDLPVGLPYTFYQPLLKNIDIEQKIDRLYNIFIDDKNINPFFYKISKKVPIGLADYNWTDIKIPNNSNFVNKLIYNECVDNEIELVHRYFNLLFRFNKSLNIKKCWECNRYFISKPNNTHNCDRIFKKNLTCSEYSERLRRQFSHDQPIKDLKNYIRHKLQNDYYAYKKYSSENLIKMEEFYGKKKEYILWSLTYCDDYVGEREKIIKKFKLEKYLNDK